MNFVMVCSMCITSPLILPFGLLYFVGLWAVWRYQALYVYQRQYESGGQVRAARSSRRLRLPPRACRACLRAWWAELTCRHLITFFLPPPAQFWPLVAHKVVGCQFIMVVFTACVLLFKVRGSAWAGCCGALAWDAGQRWWPAPGLLPTSRGCLLRAGRLHPGGPAVHHPAHLPAAL